MKKGNLREIIDRLWHELQRGDEIDSESREKLEELRRHVERMDEPESADVDSLWDRAKELESRFAVEHPTLERIARDLADALGKMGV